MDIGKLVKMANEISQFFEADPDTALEGLTNHLAKFWEPRMRTELLAWVDETRGDELRPLVREAIRQNRARLMPRG